MFAAQVESNMSEYRGHYVRQELNVRMYMNTFQHTHRLDSRQRAYAAALRDELLQDHRSGSLPAMSLQPDRRSQDPWDVFVQQLVHTLLSYAHRIDSMEAQQKNAHPVTADPVVEQLFARVLALESKPDNRSRGSSQANANEAPTERQPPSLNPGPITGPGRFMGRGRGRGRDDPSGRGRGRGRDDGRRNASSSGFMASDPPVTIHSGSAVVSAGTVAAASSSACQRGRPPPDFQAFAADCDAQLQLLYCAPP